MTDRRTELRHPDAAGLQDAEPNVVLARLLAAQLGAADTLPAAFDAIVSAADRCADAISAGGRLIYAGAGSSGLMALADCLELAGTFGIPPDRTPMLFPGGAASLLHMTGAPEDDPSVAAADVAAVAPGPDDVVLCVSASGATPYTLEIARSAGRAGATIVAMANVRVSPLIAIGDIAIVLDSGPEIIAGSTRMGAGTAQKIALNMLSVLVGLRLGHVYEGYMVNLVADNAKLVDRAARIVQALAGVDRKHATDALSRTGGAVKPAILVAVGATPEAAEAALQSHRGHLGPALAEVTG